MTFKERAKQLVSQMTLDEKISQMLYDAPAIKRLGIPAYNWWNECLHGVARQGTATVFPQAISLAASFNSDLLYEVADAISDEARAKYNQFKKFGYTEIYQGLTFWSPNINIFRDPRWGRGHETYGEDPYLTAIMGTAFVKGLQGEGKYRKVDATLKHFAVHSGPENKRHGFNAIATDKDMEETYLWAFKYCVQNADPSAVMGAYNRVNGEACCASKTLLCNTLRGSWKFDGYVVSDCGAIRDINANHKITADDAESAALAVENGCDLNCGQAYRSLSDALRRGLIDEAAITKAVERLFEARFRLGMFDDDCEYDNIPFDVVDSPRHQELNLKMAREGIVLLKNDGILPLSPHQTVAVIGPNADDKSVLLGNYFGTPKSYTTPLSGIISAADKVIYARGCHPFEIPDPGWAEQPTNEAIIAAENADVVVMIMGLNPLMEGEEGDAYNGALGGDKLNLELPRVQRELIEKIVAIGKPTVFVNISGSCVNLDFEDKNFGAVVQCFYPGSRGGEALADVLFGKYSPSGRLPVTFYKSVDDLPGFEDYSMEGRTYKFYKGKPVYPFGHGLNYSEINENWIDENTVELLNLGEYDTDYSVLKYEYIPYPSLCGFKKVHIKAGEKITCKF